MNKQHVTSKRKGHPISEETKRKIRVALTGKRMSLSAKRKMSEARKGKQPWNKGKTYHAVLKNGGYYAIHKWLTKHWGKASHCEGNSVDNHSKMIHWALKKGFKYEHKRENFIQLCSRCHRLYDQKKEWIEKMRKTKIGSTLSEEHKQNIRIGMLKHDRWGSKNPHWKGGISYGR